MTRTDVTYETGTLGAAVGSPDSDAFANAGSTGTYDNTHVLHGSQSLKITPAASTIAESRVTSTLNTTQLSVIIPFYYTTTKSADEGIFRIEDTSGVRIIGGTWNSSGRISITDKSGTSPRLYLNTTAAPPLNQWCLIKIWLLIGGTATTGSVKYALYDSTGTAIGTASGGVDTPFTSSAANLGTVIIGHLWVGRDGAQAATDPRWYDTISYDPAASDLLPNYVVPTPPPVGALTDNQALVVASSGTSPYTISPTTNVLVLGGGQWVVPKDPSSTINYTITDAASKTAVVTVPPISSGTVAPSWPKHWNSLTSAWE